MGEEFAKGNARGWVKRERLHIAELWLPDEHERVGATGAKKCRYNRRVEIT